MLGHRRDKSDPSGLADEVAEAISSGRQSIEGRRDSAEANRTSAVQGAVDLGQQVTDKQNRRWFEEKDRGD